MPLVAVEEKLRQLPECYMGEIYNYLEMLLEREKKIQSLKGAIHSYANPDLRAQEEGAFERAMESKHGKVD